MDYLENIDIAIDIDKNNLEQIDIDKDYLENIYIVIDIFMNQWHIDPWIGPQVYLEQ